MGIVTGFWAYSAHSEKPRTGLTEAQPWDARSSIVDVCRNDDNNNHARTCSWQHMILRCNVAKSFKRTTPEGQKFEPGAYTHTDLKGQRIVDVFQCMLMKILMEEKMIQILGT